jgi:hypothetical protein
MKRLSFLCVPIGLVLVFALSFSCGGVGSSVSGFIDSLSADMKKCAPDLSSATSALTQWNTGSDGWSMDATYGVLRKHFDPDSGLESIYGVVEQLDQIVTDLSSDSDEIVNNDSGTVTFPDGTATYEAVSTDVTLPSIFGGTAVSGFEKKVTVTITATGMTNIMYFKLGDTDEKILFYYNIPSTYETGVVYATRNKTSGALAVKVACHKAAGSMLPPGSSQQNNEFRLKLYFEGNTLDQSFTFNLKTDAGTGWSIFGGGSVAADSDLIAVRGTDEADSQTYANDGGLLADNTAASYYVVISFGNLKTSGYDGGGYPKSAANLSAETSAVKKYITIGNASCPYDTVTSWQAFIYPQEATELSIQ